MAKKKIVGFISGAYASDQNDYPTHSLVTINDKDVKKILGFMDKFKTPAFRGVNALEANIGTCEWFRLSSKHDEIAEVLGINEDTLYNIDTDTTVPLTNFGDIFDIKDDEGCLAADAYASGGVTYCHINKNGVYWQGFESHRGSNMESPFIRRETLETWLKGV